MAASRNVPRGPTLPDRQAQERLAEWRAADRAEAGSTEGSRARRNAVSVSRKARYRYEDAARAAGEERGNAAESAHELSTRVLRRLAEASHAAAELQPFPGPRAEARETDAQRDKRVDDEAEFRRELAD